MHESIRQAQFRSSKHTILLVQYQADKATRTFLEFPSVNAAMDGVIKMYEVKLKQLNPNVQVGVLLLNLPFYR